MLVLSRATLRFKKTTDFYPTSLLTNSHCLTELPNCISLNRSSDFQFFEITTTSSTSIFSRLLHNGVNVDTITPQQDRNILYAIDNWYYDYQLSMAGRKFVETWFWRSNFGLPRGTFLVPSGYNIVAHDFTHFAAIDVKPDKLPLETAPVARDNNKIWTSKHFNELLFRLTQLIIVVSSNQLLFLTTNQKTDAGKSMLYKEITKLEF